MVFFNPKDKYCASVILENGTTINVWPKSPKYGTGRIYFETIIAAQNELLRRYKAGIDSGWCVGRISKADTNEPVKVIGEFRRNK